MNVDITLDIVPSLWDYMSIITTFPQSCILSYTYTKPSNFAARWTPRHGCCVARGQSFVWLSLELLVVPLVARTIRKLGMDGGCHRCLDDLICLGKFQMMQSDVIRVAARSGSLSESQCLLAEYVLAAREGT